MALPTSEVPAETIQPKVFHRASSSRLDFDPALGDLTPLAAFRDDISPSRRDIVRKFLYHFGLEGLGINLAAKTVVVDLLIVHEMSTDKHRAFKTKYNLEQDVKALHCCLK